MSLGHGTEVTKNRKHKIEKLKMSQNMAEFLKIKTNFYSKLKRHGLKSRIFVRSKIRSNGTSFYTQYATIRFYFVFQEFSKSTQNSKNHI